MFDRMPAEKLAKAKGKAQTTDTLNRLATTALPSSGATRVEQRRAAAELERAVGPRKAKRLQEDALQRAGAKKRGWFS
jgi:hypothetical protein